MTVVRKFGIGQPLKRVEDIRLVTGAGQYAADVREPAALIAVFLRSPHAHAHFKVGNLAEIRAMPGVHAVYLAADFPDIKGIPCNASVDNADGSLTELKPYPVLSHGVVQHVGDAIAMVVADSEEEAKDALDAAAVDWNALPAVVDMEEAIKPGAPALFAPAANNIAYDTYVGDPKATEAAFKAAHKIVSIKIVNPRVVSNYMEPRSALAKYNEETGRYWLNTGTQGVHNMRAILAEMFAIDKERIHVVNGDVGGGFGTKGFTYREYPVIMEAAKRLKRPVRWTSDRSEHFLACAHGRDNVTTAQMALDKNGRFLGMKVDILGNLGAYLMQFAPYIPWLGASMATGAYDVGALHARVRGVYTHTVPVDAYRGAGRPEAAYVLERLVDKCARAMGLSQEEIRARNFVKPSQMPFATKTERTYDVGDFEGAMRACAAKADVKGFSARAAASKAKGRLRGIGFSSYIECTAWGDGEQGSVAIEKNGDFTVLIGTQSNGQGHETAYAQVVAEYLDVPLERVKVVQGDSDRMKTGGGTGGSRSIPIGAVMLQGASRKLVASLKDLASDKLEAAVQDLEVADGGIRIAGTDRSISYAELAALPGAANLKGVDSFDPPEATYPNGTHIVEVEVDPDTGATQVARYCIVDDFGMTLNPLLLAGQVHGGVVQGVGQALLEEAVYGSDGQLMAATLMDYALPRADSMPEIEFETRNIPSTTNPMGLKGAGEAGSIGSTPAVVNAVADALYRGFGVEDIDMPATPMRVFRAIRSAKSTGAAAG